MIKLFVGLGNPGRDYEATRHNAGFWFVDKLAAMWKASMQLDRTHQALTARCQGIGPGIWLLQPQTFMNLSGRSVGSFARFLKIQPQEILVAYDELDLSPGEGKLKLGGSSTHNGLRDITSQIGANYWRLRIGIGHPGHRSEVLGWVLKKPPADQRALIDQSIERSLVAVPHLLKGEIDRATQIVHTSQPERPKPARRDAPRPEGT